MDRSIDNVFDEQLFKLEKSLDDLNVIVDCFTTLAKTDPLKLILLICSVHSRRSLRDFGSRNLRTLVVYNVA